MEPVDAWTHEAEEGGEKGQRRTENHDNRGDGADRQAVHKRQSHHEQPQQRNDHRAPSKGHGPPGGAQSYHRRLSGVAALAETLAVAGDDKQGVIDSDPEADHRHQLGSEGRHGKAMAGQIDETKADADANQGGEQGQAHGHHRPEGDQHDHHGGRDPNALAGPRVGGHGGGDRCSAQRHLEPRMTEALGYVNEMLGLVRVQIRGGGVELDDGEGGMSVSGHLLGGARCQRAAHPAHLR